MLAETRSILVTGGSGFIGKYLCAELTKRGWNVVSVDVNPPPGEEETTGTIYHKCDITESGPLEAIFQGKQFDAIVHLASILPTASQQDPHKATNVNVGGSLNILEAAKRFHVGKVIYASSSSVYGTRPASVFVNENQALAPENLYGAAKRYVELLGEAYRQNCGVRFLALRIAIVVGAGARSTTSAWRSRIFECLSAMQPTEFEIPSRPDEVLPLIHVEDLAAMLVAMVSANKVAGSVYNSFAESVTAAELKTELELLNPKIRVRLGTAPVNGHPRAIDSSRFAKDFGMAAMPLRERLRRAAEAVSKTS